MPVNTEIDISIAMVAPTNKTGAIRGNWRMQTTVGQFFGDEVYVIIVVGSFTLTPTSTTAAPTNTSIPPTATQAPTDTATATATTTAP